MLKDENEDRSRQTKGSVHVQILVIYLLCAFFPGCLCSNYAKLFVSDIRVNTPEIILSIFVLLFPYIALVFLLLGFTNIVQVDKYARNLRIYRIAIVTTFCLTIIGFGIYLISTFQIQVGVPLDLRSGWEAPVGTQFLGAWLGGASSGLLLLLIGQVNTIAAALSTLSPSDKKEHD